MYSQNNSTKQIKLNELASKSFEEKYYYTVLDNNYSFFNKQLSDRSLEMFGRVKPLYRVNVQSFACLSKINNNNLTMQNVC